MNPAAGASNARSQRARTSAIPARISPNGTRERERLEAARDGIVVQLELASCALPHGGRERIEQLS